MEQHPYDRISLASGELLLTPCPGTKGFSVEDSITTLKNEGAQAIITLMSTEDLLKNNVEVLPKACDLAEVLWFHMPIIDNQAPDQTFIEQLNANSTHILSLLAQGKTIAIHCKGGSGRTGLMAALVMLLSGEKLDSITKKVQKIRPKALVKAAQIEFLQSFGKNL